MRADHIKVAFKSIQPVFVKVASGGVDFFAAVDGVKPVLRLVDFDAFQGAAAFDFFDIRKQHIEIALAVPRPQQQSRK